MFILDGDGRELANFERYAAYSKANQHRFPPGALHVAQSTWYGNFNDHRCPHDGRLESLEITEQQVGPA